MNKLGILYCDGKRFRKALLSAASWLSQNSAELDQLNVFPVPDGDTGANMSLTLISAVNALEKDEDAPLHEVLAAVAHGSLIGARGCSGVILSQLLLGFEEVGRGKLKLDGRDIVKGLELGLKRAYNAIIEPREGTILTVIRESIQGLTSHPEDVIDIAQLLETIYNRAQSSLENTPKLLPVLAQAGVVDAGGKGFVRIIEGILRLIHGEPIEIINDRTKGTYKEPAQARVFESWDAPYCTEFILTVESPVNMKDELSNLGKDLLVVEWENIIRVHIHTGDPERVLAIAHTYGKPLNVKIDDMRRQHTHIIHSSLPESTIEKKEVTIIAISPGDGLSAIFKSLGADYVILNNQISPSVQEILNYINLSPTDRVILLPNDANVIPSSVQAGQMSNKDVIVLPSKNVPQGISAMVAFQPTEDIDKNLQAMASAMKGVKHGEITRAIRDSKFENLQINKGDIIGRFNGAIHTATKNVHEATVELLGKMVDADSEIITMFYSSDIPRDEAEELCKVVSYTFKDQEVELHYGGQTNCLYILSVE